jgi:hypothetical protein
MLVNLEVVLILAENKWKQYFLILLDGKYLNTDGQINISERGDIQIPKYSNPFLLK